METESSPSLPTPDEAAAALHEVQRARSSLGHEPVPWWYFPLLSLLGLFPLISLLRDNDIAFFSAVAATLVALGVILRVCLSQVRVVPKISGWVIWLIVAVGGVLSAGALVIENVYDSDWGHYAFSALWVGSTLAFGVYRRWRVRKPA